MTIKDVKFKKCSLRLRTPVRVSFGLLENFETVVLRLDTDEGVSGYGEAAPLPYVTGETTETALCICSLFDIASKRAGLPLYRFLGGSCNAVETDITVGLDDADKMAQRALELVSAGFRTLKLKLGDTVELDAARVRAVRERVDGRVALRVDANQAYDSRDARLLERSIRRYDIQLLEQPVRHDDITALREVTVASEVPVFADESCHSPADAFSLLASGSADGVNIKLMKCGGIGPALNIAAVSAAAGRSCMIGCMAESPIANAAAFHLAASKASVIRYVDLDSAIAADCHEITGGFTNEAGTVTLTDKPGLGVAVMDF